MESVIDTDAMPVQSARLSPRRARNAAGLDGRVRTARRIKAVAAELKAQVGVVEAPLLQRAAELQVCAELLRGRLVRGESGVAVAEVVKLENLASRALRDLRNRATVTREPAGQALAQYLASLPDAASHDATDDEPSQETADDEDRTDEPPDAPVGAPQSVEVPE